MRYEIHGESVRFYLDTPKRDDPIVRKVSFEGTRLNAEQIRPMLDLAVERLRAQSLHSQINFVTRVLARMFRGFLALEESWPSNSQDWTLFALNLFEWYLTTDESGARTYVRLKIWRSAWIPWFSFLKEAEIIPLDVVIPSAKAKKLASLGHDVKSLLGHGQRNIVDPIVSANKLLVDVSLVMTDADYLEGVDQQCRHLVASRRIGSDERQGSRKHPDDENSDDSYQEAPEGSGANATVPNFARCCNCRIPLPAVQNCLL